MMFRDFLYYEVTGRGPALVLAHGVGGNHLSWWQQVPHFADRYTCISFAHRGFHPSREAADGLGPEAFADDLSALVEHLKLDTVTLIGQSMGGWTCLEYALRAPERVRAMVMASTSGTVDFSLTTQLGDLGPWRTRCADLTADLRRRGINPAAGERMVREQPALGFLYAGINALSPSAYRERIRAQIMRLRTRPPEVLSRLPMPVLYITGEEDLQFPSGAAAVLAAMTPRGRGVMVPEAGHSAHFERAAAFNRLVDEFLAEYDPAI